MTPPQNIEAEQALLGSCLVNGHKAIDEASLVIQSIDFYRETHRVIFESMLELSMQRVDVNIITMCEVLGESLDKVGGREYLLKMAYESPTANVNHYADIIKEKSLARMKIEANIEENQRLYDGDNASTIISQSMVNSMNLLNLRKKNDIVKVGSVLPEVYEQINDSIGKDGITGTPSGIKDLDNICGGLQVGMLILAARPSMGKTTFAMNVARNVSEAGKDVLIFSLEMTKKQLVRKFLSMESGINSKLFNNASKITDGWWSRLSTALGKLSDAKMYIDDTSGLKASEIMVRSRQFKTFHENLGLIVIDYIGLMAAEKDTGNKNNEIGVTSQIIKTMSKELDVPVLVLCQLSRAVEGRSSKIPVMSDLRESGNLEQDADMIMFLHRKDYYEPENGAPDPSETDLIIAKNRLDGGVGAVKLYYFKSRQKFEMAEMLQKSA